jgi:hypothetical protein
MKIAICLSGQFRTGEYALPSLLNFFQGHDCDYFCHSWQDNNMRLVTPDRHRKTLDTIDSKFDKDYIESTLQQILKPKKIVIEEHSRRDAPYVGPWSELFYSLMMANWLKKEYEVENNFKYDLVVKTRYDFVYSPGVIFNPICHQHEPLTNHIEIFTNGLNRMNMEYSRINISDTFFYGNTNAMDTICDIYRYLQYRNLGVSIYDFDSPGPGCLLSEFASKHNIRISSAGMHEVIYRHAGIGLDVVKDYHRLSELNREMYK